MAEEHIDKILKERGAQYGDFASLAELVQTMKVSVGMHLSYNANFAVLNKGQQAVIEEALDMILLKIGRLAVGDPTKKDTWDDIAGYALLPHKSMDRAE